MCLFAHAYKSISLHKNCKKSLYFLYSLLVINVFLLLRYERRYMFLKNYLDIDVIDFTTLLKIEEKNLLSAKKKLDCLIKVQ